jgi:hypothetical protein
MLEQTIDLVDGGHRGFDQLVAFALFATVRSLPAMSRTWWSDAHSRHLAAKLLKFVEQVSGGRHAVPQVGVASWFIHRHGLGLRSACRRR